DVTCKTHSVITVGSVITRPTEAFFIYSGNPAQKIKQRAIQ
ncbi:MAG: colanic acid biosynthesis acetyltransferase WcaF, partial [Bacteroidia bacterium]|nr:colanic acid biosynthesis acetyltransferase WcaF [Bacteroidia bacterium]